MKYQKFNKYEKKEIRSQQIQNALHGEGVYLYVNPTSADITLPRPTKSGIRSVGPKAQFQGDNYYMQLVRQGLLRLVKEIQSPEQQRAANEPKMEEKLILDQPDTITEAGKIEHVVKKPSQSQKLNEGKKGHSKTQPDVLLNESPADGGFLIVQ
jgi:hypothetical protein